MGCSGVDGLFRQSSALAAPPQAIPEAIRQTDLSKNASGDTVSASGTAFVYDPSVISYEQLPQVFWENHDPAQKCQGNDHGTQYRSAIYPLTPEQTLFRASLERFQAAMFKPPM